MARGVSLYGPWWDKQEIIKHLVSAAYRRAMAGAPSSGRDPPSAGVEEYCLSQQEELLAWVRQVAAPQSELHALAGDASFRRYFRARAGERSWIVALAPPATEKNREFVAVARWLGAQGVTAPVVQAADLARGYLLLPDLGDRQYLPELNAASADALYGDALRALLLMQRGDTAGFVDWQLPDYDAELLQREMALFPEWFVEKLLGHALDDSERALLADTFARLTDNALAQPQVFVHRDYHARNLLVLAQGNPGVLDFQDAVRGAITYDLVSLLRDCYIRWPEARVRGWALAYRDQARAAGLIDEVDDAAFLRWFDLMGLQRHIKVLGIFARLWLRDGKAGYLKDLPLVIHYTLDVAGRYPELAAFVDWFKARLAPLIARQDWAAPAPEPVQ